MGKRQAIILGKEISPATTKYIAEIETSLHKPVVYQFTEPKKTKSYGQCDPWQSEAYYVYCKESLLQVTRKKEINIPFETNLLHELMHLQQIEEGYPHTATLRTAVTAQDPVFWDAMGTLVYSVVMDLNVEYRLNQLGYTSAYFHEQNCIRAEKDARHGYIFRDEIQFVRMALQLMGLYLTCPRERMEKVLSIYSKKNQSLVNCVITISEEISEIGYSDAETTFRSLVFLFSAFNLWRSHQISFRGKDYRSVSAVKGDYRDIKILAQEP